MLTEWSRGLVVVTETGKTPSKVGYSSDGVRTDTARSVTRW